MAQGYQSSYEGLEEKIVWLLIVDNKEVLLRLIFQGSTHVTAIK